MKATLSALIVGLVGFSGCTGARYEEVLDKSVETIVAFNATLENITDLDSAKAARPKLEQISQQMVDVASKIEKLGAPPKELSASYAEKIRPTADKIGANMLRLNEINESQEVLTEISSALMTIMSAAERAKGAEAPEGASSRY